MKTAAEYKDFIGIYDESVPVKLCEEFVNNWEEAQKNNTIIDLTKKNESGYVEKIENTNHRKDEIAKVTPLYSTIYPKPPVDAYFEFLEECVMLYLKKYSIYFDGPICNDVFKIHKVRKSEGFHAWHYEKADSAHLERLMVYMTYLEAPERGGETEFLHQSLRIDPIVGRTLIWPATYTHMHRGTPPLEGEKMYITGWLNSAKISGREGLGK